MRCLCHSGGIGLVWSIFWFVFVYETPASHPRISDEERTEIEDAIGSTTSKKRPTYVPWGSILTSPCVWAIIITHGCSVFGYFTVVNQLPTYFKMILHFNIKEVGFSNQWFLFGPILMRFDSKYLERPPRLAALSRQVRNGHYRVVLCRLSASHRQIDHHPGAQVVYRLCRYVARPPHDCADLCRLRSHMGCGHIHVATVHQRCRHRRIPWQWSGYCAQLFWHHLWHGQYVVVVWWLFVVVHGGLFDQS